MSDVSERDLEEMDAALAKLIQAKRKQTNAIADRKASELPLRKQDVELACRAYNALINDADADTLSAHRTRVMAAELARQIA